MGALLEMFNLFKMKDLAILRHKDCFNLMLLGGLEDFCMYVFG